MSPQTIALYVRIDSDTNDLEKVLPNYLIKLDIFKISYKITIVFFIKDLL